MRDGLEGLEREQHDRGVDGETGVDEQGLPAIYGN